MVHGANLRTIALFPLEVIQLKCRNLLELKGVPRLAAHRLLFPPAGKGSKCMISQCRAFVNLLAQDHSPARGEPADPVRGERARPHLRPGMRLGLARFWKKGGT